jgi:hypothetical protein
MLKDFANWLLKDSLNGPECFALVYWVTDKGPWWHGVLLYVATSIISRIIKEAIQ